MRNWNTHMGMGMGNGGENMGNKGIQGWGRGIWGWGDGEGNMGKGGMGEGNMGIQGGRGIDEQHTGIILTSEVCVSVRRSGDLANGRRDV
jgi:hypothetical protein